MQALLSWGFSRENSVVVHPTDMRRMQEDIKALNVCLDDSEVAEIKELDGETRFCDPYKWWGVEIFGL
jgi:diketogulonate reductase-like aldo/keto reductase